jgi:hypothetical protein
MTHQGKRVLFRVRPAVFPPKRFVDLIPILQNGKVGEVAQELYSALTDLQSERAPDNLGWLLPVNV